MKRGKQKWLLGDAPLVVTDSGVSGWWIRKRNEISTETIHVYAGAWFILDAMGWLESDILNMLPFVCLCVCDVIYCTYTLRCSIHYMI